MRTGTILFLLGLIVLFAFFGVKAIGWVLGGILLLVLTFFAAVAVGVVLLRRRMNRRLRELQSAILQAQERQRTAAGRADAIDVEPTRIRDEGR